MTIHLLSVCVLTPGGRGAVASIGVRGDLSLLNPFFQAVNGQPVQSQSVNRICFGHWGDAPCEEVVLVRTGEADAEVHCHGGTAAVERILQNLRSVGGKVQEEEEWLKETLSDVEAECRIALTRAMTQRTAHHLLRQCVRFPAALQELQRLSPEEQIRRIDEMLRWGEFGRHLTVPWKVVLCGRPNVGKSSLTNALVGFARTVVFDQPGTTRDVVAVETALEGWPVELSDTAGMRQADEDLEAAGIARARERLEEAEQIVVVLDASAGMTEEDRFLLAQFPGAIVVWNKIDVAREKSDVDLKAASGLKVSALRGEGIEELIRELAERLVPEIPPEEAVFPVTTEQCERLACQREMLLAGHSR